MSKHTVSGEKRRGERQKNGAQCSQTGWHHSKIGCGFYEVFYGIRLLCFRPFWFQLNENVYKRMRICKMVGAILCICFGIERCGPRLFCLSVCVSFVANFRWRLSVWLCRKSFLRFEEWEQTGAPNVYMKIHVWIYESNACVGIKAIVMGKTL